MQLNAIENNCFQLFPIVSYRFRHVMYLQEID